MRVILDNIIFSLQNSGGISVYWYQHIKRLLENGHYVPEFIEEYATDKNMFRSLMNIREERFLKTKSIPKIGRYLNFRFPNNRESAIFHSSYYRYSKNPNHINVTTVHDFTYEHFSTGLKRFVHSAQKKKAILRSDGIICISENTKKDLLHFIPEAADKRVRVIYNGVENEAFNTEASLWRTFPFHKNKYIVYVGERQAKYKNFKTAVASCAATNKSLIMVGGGPLQENEEVLLNQFFSKKDYQYLGQISIKALNQVYSNAFCLLYPSSYEGFGIPTIEAQKAGCPVIALNASSIPEVVGKGGLLVSDNSPEAFIAALNTLENDIVRKNLVEEGIKNAKNFSWENMHKETLDFYRELSELKRN